MRLKRTLPPAGAPIYLKDIAYGLLGMARPRKTLKKFEEELRLYFGVKHVFLVSSGKAALTLILQALHEITGKREVIIPSYTCFSVPSSVVRAGLKPVICDIMRNDFNYDVEQLEEAIGPKTLCVVANHLFGIPCDMDAIISVARSRGSYVVEDAAQAMGAELYGKKVGAIGDVGFFSLGRGKNICAVSGGIIVTNNDLAADVISKRISVLQFPGLMEQLRSLCVAVFIYMFSRPSLYWFPSGLPFLKLGQTIFSTKFPVGKLGAVNAGLATDWRRSLEVLNKSRMNKAGVYRSNFNGILSFPEPEDSVPVYLRYPLVAKTAEEREGIFKKLDGAGLGASTNYPTGIAEIPELGISEEIQARMKNGNRLAKQLLTVPTHANVSLRDQDAVLNLCRESTSYVASRPAFIGD